MARSEQTMAPAGQDALATARVHYQRWGTAGPRVVLLHPIGFDLHTWESVVPYLEDAYQLLALDLPGHGQSDKPLRADYSLPSLAGRVLSFIQEQGWNQALFIGNSIGGGVALAATFQAPERVSALVLINTVAFRRGLWPVGRLAHLPGLPVLGGYCPPFAMRLGLRFARSGWTHAGDELCQRCTDYLRAPEGRAAFFRTLRQLYGPSLDEMARHYGAIRCPTLLLHGGHDPLIRFPHAERLAAAIPGAELHRLPGCGHFPQEECAEAVGQEIRRFLDGLPRPPGG